MSTISDLNNVTAEQLARMPDDVRRRELVNGALKMMSPAGGRHGEVAFRLSHLLGAHVLPNRLGTVFAAETGFILSRNPDTVRAPDVAFVCQDRIDTIDDMTGYVPLAPDLVAEVISPHDRFSEVEEKAWFWIRSGVQAVLIVDPANRTVRLCRAESQMALFSEPATVTIDDVVPGWRLSVAELFAS